MTVGLTRKSQPPLVVENSSGWAIFIRDITRRKKSVAELQTAKEAAERANMAKSEFVANVSHELRTPLTGIVGLHELLDRSALDDQQREYLTLARTSSDNLLALIDALLDFSKIEAHRLQLEHEPLICWNVWNRQLYRWRARPAARIRVSDRLRSSIAVQVVGDGGRVRQILLNLIGNAIKFTERGNIQVRVQPDSSAAAPSAGISWIRFDVIDAGIGIRKKHKPLFSRRFFKPTVARLGVTAELAWDWRSAKSWFT